LYDFIKTKGIDIGQTNIVNNPLLPFVTKNVSDDGELFKSHKTDRNGNPIYRKPYRIAEYNGLSFSYSNIDNPRSFYMSGSLHKYFNEGVHNYNDFRKEDIDRVLLDLQEKFDIDLKTSHYETLETGVNIILPTGLTARDVIQGCLFHGRKRFVTKKDDQWGQYIQCEHSQYIIKIYDKGLQYRKLGHDIAEEILRFEIKFTKHEIIKGKTGITNLSDLLTCKRAKIQKVMLNEWARVFLFDPSLKIQDERIYKYSTHKYWEELANRKKENSTSKKSNSTYYKHRKKYQELVDTYSEKIHLQIANLIEEKIKALFYEGATFDHLPIMSKLTPPIEKQERICPVDSVTKDREIKTAEVRKYAVDLFKNNLKKYKGPGSFNYNGKKSFDEEQAERIAKRTAEEVQAKYIQVYNSHNLTTRKKKIFICPVGSVVDWEEEILLLEFRKMFLRTNVEVN